MLEISRFNETIYNAYTENAPNKICQYVYDLANAFNKFYHGNKIISEENEQRRESWIALIRLTSGVLNTCINLLGFEAPERM